MTPSSAVTGLPQPTADIERGQRDLADHGYCMIADALGRAEIAALRDRLMQAAWEDVDAGRAFIDGGGANQRVWALINRGSEFCQLAEHPLAIAMMSHLLSGRTRPGRSIDGQPDFLLGSITANVAGPGGEPMYLHSDQGYVPFPWPPFPLVANIAWMLDDFTAANGATRIVPGSHRVERLPTPADAEYALPAEAPAGTALIFDGRVWHGTGMNTTADAKRHGILAYYCQPWMRQQENHTVSTDAAVVRSASPTLRRLLGFELYSSLGMVNGLPGELTGFRPAGHHHRPPDRTRSNARIAKENHQWQT